MTGHLGGTSVGTEGTMRVAVVGFSIALCLVAAVSAPAISPGPITIKLAPFATIPSADGPPLDVVSANDGSGRIFVAGRNGVIDVLSSTGALQPTKFLNMSTAGLSVYTGGEGGLLGMAFSPNYATNGLFYTFQTETYSTANPSSNPPADFSEPELRPTTTTNPNNMTTIREWHVSGATPMWPARRRKSCLPCIIPRAITKGVV